MGSESQAVNVNSNPSFIAAPFQMISNIIAYKSLLRNLVSRDFKNTYHGHILGYAWSMLEPLIFTGIFYMIIVILRNSSDDILPLNIMLGILMYSAFAKTLQACTVSLTRNSALIQQIYFPREIILTAISGFQSVRLLLSMIIVVPYMIYASLYPTALLLLFPLAAISAILFAQGLGMILVIIHVRIRDTEQIIALVIRAGFYLSGVFYGAEMIPVEYLDIFLANPVAVFIEMGRTAIFGEIGVLETIHVVRAVCVSIITFLIGSIVFIKNEKKAVLYL
jgi:ABC-type polysaccharide/polyol phosphate export permease